MRITKSNFMRGRCRPKKLYQFQEYLSKEDVCLKKLVEEDSIKD